MSGIIADGPAARELALDGFAGGDGRPLTGLRLQYRVVGDEREARKNGWILVFHALTGSADVAQWWSPLIGPGREIGRASCRERV